MSYVIYMYTNTVTGKRYVGQTQNLQQRQYRHQDPSSKCTAFRNAIQKYGFNVFVRKVLVENLTLDQANGLEVFYIKQFNTIAPNGYNLRPGGVGCGYVASLASNKGKTLSKETRAKMSAAKRGKTLSKETRAKMSAAKVGKPRSEETRAKISAGKVGKPRSEETRAKISRALKGIPKPSSSKNIGRKI